MFLLISGAFFFFLGLPENLSPVVLKGVISVLRGDSSDKIPPNAGNAPRPGARREGERSKVRRVKVGDRRREVKVKVLSASSMFG